MRKELLRLQQAQQKLNSARASLSIFKSEFEIEHDDLYKEIMATDALVGDIKQVIKEVAIEEFKKTGIKKLLGGIGIREGSVLIYNETQALTWAKEHQLCLILDKKSFEKIAKTQDLDFVEKEDKITTTFPKEIILEGSDE